MYDAVLICRSEFIILFLILTLSENMLTKKQTIELFHAVRKYYLLRETHNNEYQHLPNEKYIIPTQVPHAQGELILKIDNKSTTSFKKCFLAQNLNSNRTVKSVRYRFSSNPQKPNQNNRNQKRNNSFNLNKQPSEQQLSKLIFCPSILHSNILKIINQQSSSFSQKQMQNHTFQQSQKLSPTTVVQEKEEQIENKIRDFQRVIYLIRNFINLALKLDPSIQIMNQVDFDEDYKLDTLYKVRDNQFLLIDLLQKQLQRLKNNGKQRQKISHTHDLSRGKQQKSQESMQISQLQMQIFNQYQQVAIIMTQIILLVKILQLSPNQKSFNILKFAFYYKDWSQRLNYFKQALPLGVQNPSFRKSTKMLDLILQNIQNLSQSQKQQINALINSLLELDFIDNQKQNNLDDLFQTQKLLCYSTQYMKDITQYHNKKAIQISEQQKCLNQQQANKKMNRREYYEDTSPQEDTIMQRRDRRLQIDYRYVQYGLLLLFSNRYSKDQKIDMLNDIRNKIQNDYQQYQQVEKMKKEAGLERKFNPERKGHSQEQNYKQNLVAYDFMEYLRANQVYTWLIYRLEDFKLPKIN